LVNITHGDVSALPANDFLYTPSSPLYG